MLLPIKDDNSYLDDHERQARGRWRPYVTYMLIAANVGVFLFEVVVTGQFIDFTNEGAFALFYEWGAVPRCIMGADVLVMDFGGGQFSIECPNNPLFTLVSSTFLHGGILHLGGNMLFLWIFGDNIEYRFGRLKYLGIYLAWGVLAGLAHVAGDVSSVIPAVGASGAVSGILGAYLVLFPRARILTILMLFFFWRMMHIQARWFLPFWLVFQNLLPFFVSGFGVAGGGVAYLAHIGGFVVGLAVGYLYKKMFYSGPTYGTRYGYRPDDYFR
ncbi:MAG: rhomboid family intramembrane serine protease [Cenarchaeum sp. SB0661_bin_35]|nr:rhomboid family intramembrane serine protease [Cenarchaeum sp. SB0667_bin_13]MXY37537.1 rhomboid family intramembrane serine protease [Cenarchaeum sp. SB0664_bin_35]MXZ93212.1 rhomboid family intramembrane serine protease [Cenarchaeum sp. SB0666_bin_15]MYB46789.1 rhomboid family intramembrane serine protease [Cenarchaeum sp. SB0662_bin_33]MYC79756.1 rhomboid family intramembrane serine protease [Cenarchaeum sp. SB0661_bin_35]MYD58626.1 rhomboid family intramembrane serine protease [Cenarcha